LKSVGEGLPAESSSRGLRVADEVVLSIEGEVLSNLEVNVSIELANLRGPLTVVNLTPSDFDTLTNPTLNVVLDAP
jgi:hypothetical protein